MSTVVCHNCHTKQQIPPAYPSIWCITCRAIIYSPYPLPNPYPPPPHVPWGCSHVPEWVDAPPPPISGRRKAVICGIMYKGKKERLEGCIEDAKFMRCLLMRRFGFSENSIYMLTDVRLTEHHGPYTIPTKENILKALRWLVDGCRHGDSLVFHFSGHGAQTKDMDGDEDDGLDEYLVPMDFENNNVIIDDEINEIIVRPLPSGVKLHAIIDACHSGTVLDLQYHWSKNGMVPNKSRKGTNGGIAICLSACTDDQEAKEDKREGGGTNGDFTFSFIEAIEYGYASTYGELMDFIRGSIGRTGKGRKVYKSGATYSQLLSMMLQSGRVPFDGSKQEPQLTSSEAFHVYETRFFL